MERINDAPVLSTIKVPKQGRFVLEKHQGGTIYMARKRLTQVFPFLLPLRKWQRKKFFYLKMKLDGNKYARKKYEKLLPHTVFGTSSLMINEKSGFDLKYQLNKVHNLKLAAATVNQVVIEPGEAFSFYQLVRYADRYEKYRDGLNLVDGEIKGAYGGGLCQLSNMLFWLFLHTPLTIVERHGHAIEFFRPADDEMPCGIDATVTEGWLDLKVRNDTDNLFQIEVSFDDEFMYGRILSLKPINIEYEVFDSSVEYHREAGRLYQTAHVCRRERDRETGVHVSRELYVNKCEIGYEIMDGTKR